MELKQHFKPEFLNRIDETVMFNSLDEKVVYQIIYKFVNQLSSRLADKKITIEISNEAKAEIAREGFDPTFGARPLKRFIQGHIETLIAKEMIKGTIQKGDHVAVEYSHGQFGLSKA